MAKETGGLLAFGARGTIGKTIVYANWRGRPYVRKWVTPANPRSAAQTLTRNTFTWATGLWKIGVSPWQATYTAAAKGRPVTDRNLWVQNAVNVLRAATDTGLLNMVLGAGGGLLPASWSPTPASNQIVVNPGAPDVPVGWTIQAAHTLAFPDQDPQFPASGPMNYVTDTTAPYALTITGLASATPYHVSLWFSFVKPDGTIAYGQSLDGLFTTL